MRTTTMPGLPVPAAFAMLAAALALSACAATPPAGPSFAAMPGQGKTLAQFREDDIHCRQAAFVTLGYVPPGQAGAPSGAANAAVGTGNVHATTWGLQRTYDVAYAQCMTAAGEKVPDVNTLPQYMPYYYPAYVYPPYYAAPYGYGYGWGW